MTSFNEDSYPEWAQASSLTREYYECEWGRRLTEEHELYELIALLGFQAGLNWSMVLNKRERLREVFHNFDPDAVAQFDHDDIEGMLHDKTLIRNRRKLSAAVHNAKAIVKLREHGGVSALVWAHQPDNPTQCETVTELIEQTPEITELAQELKAHDFTMVGPRMVAALAQAIGMVPAVKRRSNAA